MYFLVVYCIVDLLMTSQGSEIREVHRYVQSSQRDLMKYCSKIGNCEPGTHVACMYSGQSSMGPKCDSKAKPIKLAKVMQTHILSTLNGLRKRLSQGIETGENQEILPRAYGMIQVQWDEELAYLAQLWANQCQEGHDICRSTERFPNVAQTSFINSYSIKRHGVDDSWENNLTSKQLGKIIETSIDYWRRGKERVTRKNILSSEIGLQYLQMIHGQNSHVGCGMVAYTSTTFYNMTQNPNHLVIKLVCNWSHKLKPSSMVYDIDPPQGRSGGRSENCGCYSGQTEGDGCLCVSLRTTNMKLAETNDEEAAKTAEAAKVDCNSRRPTVVLMPVFTFEDRHDIPLSQIRNATAGFFNSDPVPVQTKTRYYNGGPITQAHTRPLRVPPPSNTGRHMMFERVLNQETKRSNIRNMKSRDMLNELVQEYLASNKRAIHPPVVPVDPLDDIQGSTGNMPLLTPVEVDRPVSYGYTGYFENSKPRTRRVSFGSKDSNYHHTPDIRNMNDNYLNEVLINLLEELVYHGNINDAIAKIHDIHKEEEYDHNNRFRSSKSMKPINVMDNLERYEDEATDGKIYSNIDYGHRIVDVPRAWPTIRKQDPLTHTAYDNNYDYYENDYDYENEKIIRNIERDILQSNVQKENKYLI